jgi:hypothetical protein
VPPTDPLEPAMTLSTAFQKLLADRGIRILRPGHNEIGLLRADALHAVDLLRSDGVAILGGDVYIKRGGRFDLAYANWNTVRRPSESNLGYLQRSWDSTEQYVRKYPQPADGEALFVIVAPI